MRASGAHPEPEGSSQSQLEPAERWPHGVSQEPVMSIGQVNQLLKSEFPAISLSKLRYLEDEGLVEPHRTASGYRRYSQSDVERLRFVLASQRDHFWPLKVIAEKLATLDADVAAPSSGLRDLATVPQRMNGSPKGVVVSRQELRALTGANDELLDELAEAGMIGKNKRGYPAQVVGVVESAVDLAGLGLHPRHFRMVLTGASRQADLVEQLVAPLKASGRGSAERASSAASQTCDALGALQQSLLRVLLEKRGL